ncbi:MAG: hypothetical protein JSS81_03810 [Acidobacteria bacterium]|nr:hypothetical protein [Acidobacteriota bacterium]
MDNANTQKLAEQIALLLQANAPEDDHAALRASLDKINARLDKIEAQLATPAMTSNPTSDIRHPNSHASQERFRSLAEIADAIIDQLQGDKDCPYEPAAKPCDNCSMCSSRGF